MPHASHSTTSWQTPAAQAFSRQPVPRGLVEEILDRSARAPSGVNTQPWQVVVVAGAARARLVQQLRPQVDALAEDADALADFWRRFGTHPLAAGWNAADVAHAGDAALTVAMGQRGADPSALRHYFDLAGAPMGLFFFLHEQLGVGSVLDCGMFIQNIVLTARARGLHAVLQTGWRGLAQAEIQAALAPPASSGLLAVLALGHATPATVGADAVAPVPDMATRTTWHD